MHSLKGEYHEISTCFFIKAPDLHFFTDFKLSYFYTLYIGRSEDVKKNLNNEFPVI